MAQSSTPSASALWVEKALAALLSAPHITIPPPPAGIRTGPGPIDLFSTRFDNTFTTDAKGVVDGEHVDRAGLKQKLLALQTHYNPDTVVFQAQGSAEDYQDHSKDEVHVSFKWTTKDSVAFEVCTSAIVVTSDGAERISFLGLKGQPVLFQGPDAVSGQ